MNNQKFNIDPAQFSSHFPEKAFTVKHNLATNPLFAIERLLELCKALPEKQVEYNAGTVGVNQDPSKTPRTGLSPEETIRRIQEAKSWLVMKFVEADPAYKALLDECLDEIGSFTTVPTTTKREGFIFLSSPGSVTPFHMDPEHNFLLQIRGDKTLHIFDANDTELVSEIQRERFYNGAHRNLEFNDEMQKKAQTFLLKPGDGLHFPVIAPHWVQNMAEVSVSFSITFRSPISERKARLYEFNSKMRGLGITPTPVGKAPSVDAVKDLTYRLIRKTGSVLGSRSPSAGREY